MGKGTLPDLKTLACRGRGSNPRLPVHEADALTTRPPRRSQIGNDKGTWFALLSVSKRSVYLCLLPYFPESRRRPICLKKKWKTRIVQLFKRSRLYVDFIFINDLLVWPLKLQLHETHFTIFRCGRHFDSP